MKVVVYFKKKSFIEQITYIRVKRAKFSLEELELILKDNSLIPIPWDEINNFVIL